MHWRSIEQVSRAQVYDTYELRELRLYSCSKPHLPTICACATLTEHAEHPPFANPGYATGVPLYFIRATPEPSQKCFLYMYPVMSSLARSQASLWELKAIMCSSLCMAEMVTGQEEPSALELNIGDCSLLIAPRGGPSKRAVFNACVLFPLRS
jgi:hypothetical protein